MRENSQQGHAATQQHLEGLQELVQQAQATLDAVAASTAALAVPPPPSPPTETTLETEVEPTVVLPASPAAADDPAVPPARAQQPHERVLEHAREAIQGNEVWAAGAAGAVGGVVLVALLGLAGR